MSTTMIQTVANAIWRGRFVRNGVVSAYDPCLPLTDNELDDARSAIAAMRETTMTMKEAAVIAAVEFNEPIFQCDRMENFERAMAVKIAVGDGRVHEAAHRAMIDAALSEETA